MNIKSDEILIWTKYLSFSFNLLYIHTVIYFVITKWKLNLLLDSRLVAHKFTNRNRNSFLAPAMYLHIPTHFNKKSGFWFRNNITKIWTALKRKGWEANVSSTIQTKKTKTFSCDFLNLYIILNENYVKQNCMK
jgi:hypothetical protein